MVGILPAVLRAWILLTVGAVALAGAVSGQSPSEAGFHLILARLLVAENRASEAGEHFDQAIAISPADPFLRVEYGKFLLGQRRARLAGEQLMIARQLAPDDPEVLRIYAETQMKLIGQDGNALHRAREALEKVRALNPADVDSMVSLGQIYLSESSPDEAADVFQELLDRTSGNRMVYRLLVDAQLRAGRPDRAEATLRKALDLDPFFTRARIVLAELLGQQGGHEAAIEVLQGAPSSESGDLDLQKRLAFELHRAGKLEQALETIEPILEREPDYFPALYLKAVSLASQGLNTEATELAQRLAESFPENLEVSVLLAQLLERQNRSEQAVEELRRVESRLRQLGDAEQAERAALQRIVMLVRTERWTDLVEILEPKLPELEEVGEIDMILLYAEAQARRGEKGKALAILNRFPEDSAAGRAALGKEAEILFLLGHEAEGRERIAELIASQGADDLTRAAEVYQRLERYDEAIPLLEQALELSANSTQIMFWLGASYERSGRHQDAEAMLEELLAIDPEFAPALNYLGYMWAEQGLNLERALGLVRQAVALDPDNGAYVDSLGWAHFQLGQYEEARSHLERAASLVGEDAVVFEHLGDLYVVLGRLQEAEDFYQRALALGADNAAGVQEKLERLRGEL